MSRLIALLQSTEAFKPRCLIYIYVYVLSPKNKDKSFSFMRFTPVIFFGAATMTAQSGGVQAQPGPSQWPPQPVSRSSVSKDCDDFCNPKQPLPKQAGTTPLSNPADDCVSPPPPSIVLVSGTSGEWFLKHRGHQGPLPTMP